MALAAAPDLPGFRAPAPLGFGPTSTIYGAQSLELGRWVALILYSITLPDERSQRRFRRGYEVGRRLGAHPHAVTVLDTGLTSDRRPFIAAEIYERGTLQGRIESRQLLSVSETLHVGIALAGALETAHRADVIHGGVHPGRVLLGADGEPALSDLGVVPLVDRSGLAALIGPMTHHAPPEVLEGEELGPTADVYALASTLYAALTGRAPYAGDSPEDESTPALLVRILQHAVPSLGRTDAPPSLDTALRQALSCEPKDRPARPLAFARMLQACQEELGLPVTQPIILDVAATLNLAVTPPDPFPSPVAPVPDPVPVALAPAPPPVLDLLPPPPSSPAERVFVPYPLPTPDQAETSDWPAPTEQPLMAPPLPNPVEVVPPRDAAVVELPPAPSADPAAFDLGPIESDRWHDRDAGGDDDEHYRDVDAELDNGAPGKIRALPVLVLALVVAVIFAAVTWSIVTGEAPTEERAQPGSTDSDTQPDQPDGTQSELTAVENANGVQLDWNDTGTGNEQIVLVFSTTEPLRTLPADAGTALLIPNDDLDAASGYCFAVLPVPESTTTNAELAASVDDSRLGPGTCIRSGSADSVLRD